MKLRTIIFFGLVILITETILFTLFIFAGKPDSTVSIGLSVFAPSIFVINIIVFIMLMLKRNKVAIVILINSIVSPLVFYFIWISWFNLMADRNYSQYLFKTGGNHFQIILSREDKFFSITDITKYDFEGTTSEICYGSYSIEGDSIVMVGNEYKMYLVNNRLFGFLGNSSAIGLETEKMLLPIEGE